MMAERELGSAVSPDALRPADARLKQARSGDATRQSALDIPLTVVLIVVGVLALYWRTTLSMVAIWERSETFSHGFVVVPIFFYLLWRRRDAIESIEARPCWPALFGVAAMGFAWLVGELVSAASVSQFAVIAMIPFAVWAILGTRVVSALAIPLAFLFFAVPFGEFMVPTLINRTADFTVTALRASGVPVYREGNFFLIPSGPWSVVEACSGLRYLIASLMVGCLYAYLSYRSPLRRAAFIAASLVVPIVANWMRAYMIVMIGHLSSNKLAVGADHLIYGWVFFGIVIFLLLLIGSRWREDDKPVAVQDEDLDKQLHPAGPVREYSKGTRWAALAAAFALMAVWQPLAGRTDDSERAAAIRLPRITASNGWLPVSEEIATWQPDLSGARAELRQTFVKDGHRVGLYIAFFRWQTPEAKAITSTNQIVRTSNKIWRQVGAGAVSATAHDGAFAVNTGVVVSTDARLALWQWYWVNAHLTSSDYAAKLYQAMSVLGRHGDGSAWVVVYTETEAGEAEVRPVLQSFTTDMMQSIDASLRQAANE
jgi:exosortase A